MYKYLIAFLIYSSIAKAVDIDRDFIKKYRADLYNYKKVVELYQRLNNRPIWIDDRSKYDTFNQIVSRAKYYGLNPERYKVPIYDDRVKYDILITDRLLKLAYDSYFGLLNPQEVFKTWNYKRKEDLIVERFVKIFNVMNDEIFFQTFSPQYSQYSQLKNQLEKYYRLKDGFDQKQISLKKSLKLGDSHPELVYIKRFLSQLGDYKGQNFDDRFDPDFEIGVKNFQKRHGLEIDGILGRKTLGEINVPLEERIRSIVINMEKIRWLPENLNPDRIEINIPSYDLRLYLNDELVLTMKIIVGKNYKDDFRPTPIYQGVLKEIITYPYWYVPQKIAIKDIIPKIKKDPYYLKKNNFKALYRGREVDITKINLGLIFDENFRLVQLPSDTNALGKVKFYFENPFGVYLHDTPHKELFQHPVRAFSSGCIRVEDGIVLAEKILSSDKSDLDTFYRKLENKQTAKIPVSLKIIVNVFYFTTFVDHGEVFFLRDIYDYDRIISGKFFE